jgi:hypothetical protein
MTVIPIKCTKKNHRQIDKVVTQQTVAHIINRIGSNSHDIARAWLGQRTFTFLELLDGHNLIGFLRKAHTSITIAPSHQALPHDTDDIRPVDYANVQQH